MSENEKAKKIQTIIIVACVVFALLMIIALVSNIVTLCVNTAKKADLEQQVLELQQQIADSEAEISYKETDEYIQDYAREYLNMTGADDVVFIGK